MVFTISSLFGLSNAAATLPICYSGSVGITLNCEWYEPVDSSEESKQAAERGLQFQVSFQIDFCHYCKVEPYTLPTAWIS
jgi:beta-glucosidase/6-phospho-beta-glucosidase/beta-galactosidase